MIETTITTTTTTATDIPVMTTALNPPTTTIPKMTTIINHLTAPRMGHHTNTLSANNNNPTTIKICNAKSTSGLQTATLTSQDVAPTATRGDIEMMTLDGTEMTTTRSIINHHQQQQQPQLITSRTNSHSTTFRPLNISSI